MAAAFFKLSERINEPRTDEIAETRTLFVGKSGITHVFLGPRQIDFFVGDIQATFAGLLPNPPVTRDSMKSLREDNVVADDALGLGDLGIQPTPVESILPTYVHRYRKGGRIGRASMS